MFSFCYWFLAWFYCSWRTHPFDTNSNFAEVCFMSQHMVYMLYVLWTLKIMSSINVALILLVDDVVEFYILALVFCLIALSIIEREVLKSPAVTVVSFISFFSSHILQLRCLVHIYLELLYLLGGWTLYHYIIFLPNSSNFLCSEVYSIWFLYSYSYFHLINVGMIYISFILLLSTCLCVCMCPHGCSVVYDSLRPHRLQPARILCPWNFPGKNTGAGFHFLL